MMKKYTALYEKKFELAVFFIILFATIITSILWENLIVYEFIKFDYYSIKMYILEIGTVLAICMELWMKKGNFWKKVKRIIIKKGILYNGNITNYNIITHKKGRGSDWLEYIPTVQLKNGTIITGTSFLTPFPPLGSECIVVLYKKHYIITQIISD